MGIVAGRYKLLQQIGERHGDMLIEPVKRRVAVKLIRVEKGQSKTILSRFEAERQAIAARWMMQEHDRRRAAVLRHGVSQRDFPSPSSAMPTSSAIRTV